MYREAIALALHQRRPETEVLLVPENTLDGELESFEPQILLRNDTDGAIPETLLKSVVCRIEVLYSDGMDVRVNLDGKVSTIEDASMEDLFVLADETERLVPGYGSTPE